MIRWPLKVLNNMRGASHNHSVLELVWWEVAVDPVDPAQPNDALVLRGAMSVVWLMQLGERAQTRVNLLVQPRVVVVLHALAFRVSPFVTNSSIEVAQDEAEAINQLGDNVVQGVNDVVLSALADSLLDMSIYHSKSVLPMLDVYEMQSACMCNLMFKVISSTPKRR